MKCYKEVHKYNGHYYSGFDNGYEYYIGTVAEAKGDYIYATDTIENVLDYNYVNYDMEILEMETIGEYNKSGYVVTCKKMKIVREVNREEYYKESTKMVGESCSELYDLLQQARGRILSSMQS